MPKRRVKNKVLIDLFYPYGRPEISIKGAIAQIVAIIIGIALFLRIISGTGLL